MIVFFVWLFVYLYLLYEFFIAKNEKGTTEMDKGLNIAIKKVEDNGDFVPEEKFARAIYGLICFVAMAFWPLLLIAVIIDAVKKK